MNKSFILKMIFKICTIICPTVTIHLQGSETCGSVSGNLNDKLLVCTSTSLVPGSWPASTANAIIAFLSRRGTELLANGNCEYPANPQTGHLILSGWGPFKQDDLNVVAAGELGSSNQARGSGRLQIEACRHGATRDRAYIVGPLVRCGSPAGPRSSRYAGLLVVPLSLCSPRS
jgi:hypothetical protein